MRGGPLSSQPSKLVWPHKAICVMNGGDLDQTGRKYVGGRGTGLDFYATPLKAGGSGFGYHFCRSPFIDRVTENDMRGRLVQKKKRSYSSLHDWTPDHFCATSGFGAHSTAARPSEYFPQSNRRAEEGGALARVRVPAGWPLHPVWRLN